MPKARNDGATRREYNHVTMDTVKSDIGSPRVG